MADSQNDGQAAGKVNESLKFEVWEPRAEDPEATRRPVSANLIAAKLLEKLRSDALSDRGKV